MNKILIAIFIALVIIIVQLSALILITKDIKSDVSLISNRVRNIEVQISGKYK